MLDPETMPAALQHQLRVTIAQAWADGDSYTNLELTYHGLTWPGVNNMSVLDLLEEWEVMALHEPHPELDKELEPYMVG